MEVIDNINRLFGDDLKQAIHPGSKLKIAASCFSIYAFEALKSELEKIESLQFIFTSPTFVPGEVTDRHKREHREFHIPRIERERSLYGSEFEVRLRNELTQKAIAKECAEWMRKKAVFRSNRGTAPMQQFAIVSTVEKEAAYLPLHGFTAVDLGYEKGNAISNFVNKFDERPMTDTYLSLFDQIWNDSQKLEDVTAKLCDHIAAVYQENSPERIYFLMLYNIFSEFLEDITADVLPNDLTGYQDSLIWKKLFNFQRDAATGIINKLETFNGCILADSVGLGKTFTALAVMKYYELRNRSVLVLCPKKLADNWLTYKGNLVTNIFMKDRFGYDVLSHTDLLRDSGASVSGLPLNRVNWGNYDLVVIDESHNFRNNDFNAEKETRYQRLLNQVIRQGVKTKVLMLSATPVNNRFLDLKNQLALAYEGNPENLASKLRSEKNIDEIFRRAQTVFNSWSTLPPQERTAEAILNALDFDFFEVLDSVTIARSRRHIQTYYDTKDIGPFPERLKPLSFHCQLTNRNDVIGFNEIFKRLNSLTLAVYAPLSYVQPSRLSQYEQRYDPDADIGHGNLKQTGREKGIQALMTVNLLKRLESSVHSFRLTLQSLCDNHQKILGKIEAFKKTGKDASFADVSPAFADVEPDADDESEFPEPDDQQIGEKVQISLSDMDIPRWEHELRADLAIIEELLAEMHKVTPSDDVKLQHLKTTILSKLASPINLGNRKVLLFTAFSDTADYLYDHLAPFLLESQRLHTAEVTGGNRRQRSTLKKTYDFQSLLTLFSPKSKDKAVILPNEPAEIDLLIGTDCISEGQNLQDCDYLINYDIHWNPVRIIQRFGRIDRIGSRNKCIQLVNFWPDISLDEYINLKERVESRMVIADVTATGDDNPLEGWDNPNVFVICTLKHSDNTISRRQEVGRGMRLSVNQNGDRIDNPAIVHQVNVLTVVANDSYKDFVAGLQKEISASLSARPKQANEEYFSNKVFQTPTGDVKVTPQMAKLVERYLIKNDYSDIDAHITGEYHQAKKEGKLAALPAELEPYKEQVFQLIDSVFSAADLPEIDDDRKGKVNPLNANFQKKEFQELWGRINRKAIYAVDFETDELIKKCIKTLEKELKVTPLQYTVTAGEQKEEAKYEELKKGDAFVLKENASERLTTTASSAIKYDLIGKLAGATQLTRKTIAAILRGINVALFSQYKTNPEDFILKAGTLINEQKATVIVEHLAYNPLEETHSVDIFTQEKKEDLSKGFKATRHIHDYVFTDSANERTFVGELDASTEVVVYAKLPKTFQIPTPVGNYSPDWAIAFQHEKVKHIYFVAETKGSMSSMDLRKIEESKIECARKFFAKITSDQVKYDVVNNYGKLMELVK